MYNIENSLEEILSGNKSLQIAPHRATNVLIGQIQKYHFNFNNQMQKFELKELNSIKVFLQNNKGISGRKAKLIETEIKNYINRNHLEKDFYNIIFSSNTPYGLLEIKEISDNCVEYIKNNY